MKVLLESTTEDDPINPSIGIYNAFIITIMLYTVVGIFVFFLLKL